MPVHLLIRFHNPLFSFLRRRRRQLSQSTLEEHFGMYGRVLRLQIFRPRNVPRGGRIFSHTGYVYYAKKTDAAK